MKEKDFTHFRNNRTFNANCFKPDGSLDKNYNSQKVTGTIATILEDHWSDYYSLNKDTADKYRPNAGHKKFTKLPIVTIKI